MLKKISTFLTAALSAILIICGLILLASLFTPYKNAKYLFDLMHFYKFFDSFTPGFYWKLKFAGAGIIVTGILSCIFFKKINLFIFNFLKCLIAFFRIIHAKTCMFFNDSDKYHLIAFFFILVLSFSIRILYLWQPIRYDEAYTYMQFVKNSSFLMAIGDLRSTNNHIFHTILVKLSYKFFGNSLWSIRLPAFIFGILVTPLSYITARIFYNKNTAIITMALISASSLLIEFTVNARGYTILAVVFLSILCLARYIKNNDNIFACILLAFFSAAGFFTMPIMAYPFLVMLIWIVLSILLNDSPLSRKINFKNLMICAILTVIFTSVFYMRAYYAYGLKSALSSNFTNPKSWLLYLKDQLIFIKDIWLGWNRDIPIALKIFFMACFILSLVFHRKFKKHKISLAIPAAICFIAANLLQKNALISARHWLFFLPAFLMITGSGLFLIIKAIQEKTGFVRLFVFPALSVVISLGLCFSVYFSQSVLKSDETGVFREGESVVDYLYNEYSKNDIIIAPDYMTQPVLFYYLDRHNLQGLCFSVKEVFNKQGSYGNIYILVSKDQKLYDLMDFYLLQNIRKNPAEKLKTFGPYCLYKI